MLFDLAIETDKLGDSVPEKAALLANTMSMQGGRLGLLQNVSDTVLKSSPSSANETRDGQINVLIEEGSDARLEKNYASGEKICDQLLKDGTTLEDAGGKTTWRRG